MVDYHPRTPAVVAFHQSKAKIKIVCSPARTSKSYAGAHEALVECFPAMLKTEDGRVFPLSSKRIWIVAPKYQLAKEFEYLWEILVDRRERYGLTFYRLGRTQNSPDQGHMRIELEWGNDPKGNPCKTIIEVRSAAHMQSIQADQADLVLMSEAADQPAEVWEKYVSTRYGRAILPTTPKIQAEWLRVMIEEGRTNKYLMTDVFEFDGTANPKYEWFRYWIEHQKAESRASATPDDRVDMEFVDINQPPGYANGHSCFEIGSKCWASRDPHFAEQFMGRWTQMEGRVLPFRHIPHYPGQTTHILDKLPNWVDRAAFYASVDYGFDDPSAVPFFMVSPNGTVVLFDLIHERGLTIVDLSKRVKDLLSDSGYWLSRHRFARPPRLEWVAGDPQNPNVRAEFRRVGLNVLAIDSKRQRDRTLGRLVFQDYLSDDPILGHPKFYVMKHCTAAIDELRLLRRKPGSVGEERYLPPDHVYDACRYFLTALPVGKRVAPKRPDPMIQQAIARGRDQWFRERRRTLNSRFR